MFKVRHAGTLTALMVLGWVLAAWWHPLLALSENQALYTFSSEAQVIAAVYGLTITGYIFLRNQQDRMADRDETLTEILDEIQGEQFLFIIFTTLLSVAAILDALATIVLRESSSRLLSVLTENSTAALFTASLVWTGLFMLDALRPGQIARASEVIKTAVEEVAAAPGEGHAGRAQVEAFVRQFGGIEALLDDFAQHHLEREPRPVAEADRARRWSKPRIVKLMLAEGRISQGLADDLIGLIRYRNALIHSQDLTVGASMIERVRAARKALEAQLQHRAPVTPAAGLAGA